jgi:hypothetical protein
MNGRGATQMAFVLGGFLGKNVALESLTALDGTARTHHEALCSALLGLHLRHNYSSLLDGHGCAVDLSVPAKTAFRPSKPTLHLWRAVPENRRFS